jgi:hypothetical protein
MPLSLSIGIGVTKPFASVGIGVLLFGVYQQPGGSELYNDPSGDLYY